MSNENMRNELIYVTTLEEQKQVLRKVLTSYAESQFVNVSNLVCDIEGILEENINEDYKDYLDLVFSIAESGVGQVELSGLNYNEEYDRFFERNYVTIFYLYNQLVDSKNGIHPVSTLNSTTLTTVVFEYVMDSIKEDFEKAINELIDDICDSDNGTNNALVRRHLNSHYRVPKGETYYYITDRFLVYSYIDERENTDYEYFTSGNYFKIYEDALILANTLRENSYN